MKNKIPARYASEELRAQARDQISEKTVENFFLLSLFHFARQSFVTVNRTKSVKFLAIESIQVNNSIQRLHLLPQRESWWRKYRKS